MYFIGLHKEILLTFDNELDICFVLNCPAIINTRWVITRCANNMHSNKGIGYNSTVGSALKTLAVI